MKCSRVSVRPSVTGRHSIKTAEHTHLDFGKKASLRLLYNVLYKNCDFFKNKSIPLEVCLTLWI